MGTTKTKRSFSGTGLVLLLFGLPFLTVGIAVGYLAYGMAADGYFAQGWIERPATIVTLRLESHGPGPRSTHPTSEVLCTYAYSFNDKTYKGDRVGLGSGSDNLNSWQHDTHERLAAARDACQTVSCFVDPSNPTDAVLDREIRFDQLTLLLLFPALFGGIGGVAAIGGIYLLWERRRIGRLGASQPQAPWLSDPRWSSPVLRPKLGRKAFIAVALVLFWNLVWWPVYVLLPAELRRGNLSALFSLIPVALGLVPLLVAVRCILSYRKFGRSFLELQTLPGIVGGELRGDLVIVGDAAATLHEIKATLVSTNSVTTRSGGKSNTNTQTLWQEQKTFEVPEVTFGRAEVHVPLVFQIPYSCRPWSEEDPHDRVRWTLRLRGSAPGIDLKLHFDVPVCETPTGIPAHSRSATAEPT